MCRTTSGTPPTSNETHGVPDATDSSAAFGRFSASVGSTNTSAAAYESAISASSTRCVSDQNERGNGGVSFAPATSNRNGSPFEPLERGVQERAALAAVGDVRRAEQHDRALLRQSRAERAPPRAGRGGSARGRSRSGCARSESARAAGSRTRAARSSATARRSSASNACRRRSSSARARRSCRARARGTRRGMGTSRSRAASARSRTSTRRVR